MFFYNKLDSFWVLYVNAYLLNAPVSQIEFVESLPKTISGKIRRIELREKEWERAKK